VLGGDMQIAADARTIAHGLEGEISEIAREAGDEAQARETGNGFVDLVEEIGKGGFAIIAMDVAVVVDGLAQQRDFKRAGIGEFGDFIDDVLRRAVNFWAAGVGDDAVGAEFITAARDADVGLCGCIGGGDGAREIEELKRIFSGGESGGAAGGGAH